MQQPTSAALAPVEALRPVSLTDALDALRDVAGELSPAVELVLRYLVERAAAVDEMVNGVGAMVDGLRAPDGSINVMKLMGLG